MVMNRLGLGENGRGRGEYGQGRGADVVVEGPRRKLEGGGSLAKLEAATSRR
jgi:hypothetical protein